MKKEQQAIKEINEQERQHQRSGGGGSGGGGGSTGQSQAVGQIGSNQSQNQNGQSGQIQSAASHSQRQAVQSRHNQPILARHQNNTGHLHHLNGNLASGGHHGQLAKVAAEIGNSQLASV